MPRDRDLIRDDPAIVASTQDYLRSSIDIAAAVGSGVVAGPMYSSVGRTWRLDADERARLLDRLTEALIPLAEHAAAAGVRLAIEPLNRFETSLFNTAEQALELIRRVDSPACGLLLDTFHMNIEERDPAAAIIAAGDHLAHFHACANDRGAPGDDHLDWGALVTALRKVDYTGAVCIESFTSGNEVIATAASVWRPLAAAQDDIATRGLEFLKSAMDDRAGPTAGARRG